jgi:hypothetical protein
MINNEAVNGNTPPFIIASFAGLLCLPAIYMATRPLFWLVHDHWATWPVFALFMLVPISVIFAILYLSAWHQEFPRLRRMVAMILSSCIIFSVDLLTAGALALVGSLVIGLAREMGGN